MCRELMLLISPIPLLGLVWSLPAADLNVDRPYVYTLSGTEEYDEIGFPDYAAFASTRMQEQFFPEGCTP